MTLDHVDYCESQIPSSGLKIGFLLESMSVASGGPSRVAGDIASALAHRGHQISIATLPSGSELVKVDSSVQIEYLAGSIKNPLNWLRSIKAIRRFGSKVDVLFVSGIWGPVDGLALRLANLHQLPVHTRICGMLEHYILNRNPQRKWIGRMLYVDRNLRHSSTLIVNTKIEGQHVSSLNFGTSISVIPNGVKLPAQGARLLRTEALKALGLDLPPTSKVLLYLSRIHPKKGLHLLLDAILPIFIDYPDWQLVVAGGFFNGNSYEEKIYKLVESSGIGARIHFTGEVSGYKKNAVFSVADLFALPSESEGFSNAIIEAMSWSIPVVITSGCNFPEVAEANAGWVIPPHIGMLRRALAEAFSNEDQRLIMGSNARGLIENAYQHDHVVDLYEKLAFTSIFR